MQLKSKVEIISCFSVLLLLASVHPSLAQTPPYKLLRSTTFFESGVDYPNASSLIQSLPLIKSTGFNAVWLVLWWGLFNPQPLASPPQFDEAAFTRLRGTLELLRENQMQAILPLNYIGSSWIPQGIDRCNWLNDSNQYSAFENYTKELLGRISDYSQMVYIIVFTEDTECNVDPYDPVIHAEILRQTLGSLPSHLPLALRNQFRIGYHDWSLINLGFGHGQSPIADPIAFDFLSMTVYGLENKSNSEIIAELDTRAARFKSLYPHTPLIIGELGASGCNNSEENQSRVIQTIASHGIDQGYGLKCLALETGRRRGIVRKSGIYGHGNHTC